ncbi:MAG: beta-galactosidase trimerization domain-containing protein [Acidobacteria bacterium]|nr:beta-galactosidase trimerization domain-containing protein [Acidobacteriota bacterium]
MFTGYRLALLIFVALLCSLSAFRHWELKAEDAVAVKMLDSFESNGAAQLWEGAFEYSGDFASQGRRSLKLHLPRGPQKGFKSEKLPKDWSKYDWLAMEILSRQQEPLILSLRIYDDLADDERADVWSEAFLATRKVFLNPGVNHLRVLLSGMRTSSDNRKMAVGRIRRVAISNDIGADSLAVCIDNLRLIQGDPNLDRSGNPKPQDTVTTIRNRHVQIDQVGPTDRIPESKEVQEKRQHAERELQALRKTLEVVHTQGLETLYAEIPLIVAELGLGIRPQLAWFNNDGRKAELFDYVAQSCQKARLDLQDLITGRRRLPEADDTQVPEPLVTLLPPLKGLAMRDGFFVDRRGDPLFILSLHSPSLKLNRFFATPLQHLESYTAGGGSRWTVDESPVYEAFHKHADAKRVGWDGWCGHLIRDRHSMGGKKEEVVICLESPHIKTAIEAYVKREAPKWMKNPELLYNILAYELQYICYCDRSQQMFREWLQRKHGRLETVNANWKTVYSSFQEIAAPPVKNSIPVSGTNRAQWYDWAVFNQQRFANHLGWVKGLVKQIDPGTPITAGGSSSMLAGSNGTSGIDEELIINQVGDVILHEGGGSTLGMDLQAALSRLKKPLCDPELSIEVRDIWPHLLHGKSVMQLWHWPAQPPSEYPHLIGPSYAHSWRIPLRDVEELLRTALDVRRLGKEIAAFSLLQPEVAILYSRTSMIQVPAKWMRATSTPFLEELGSVYEGSLYLDARTTFISEAQILDGWARRYKVLLVPAAKYVQAEVADKLLDYVNEGGHLVVSPESLIANEYLRPLDFMSRIGVRVKETKGSPEGDLGELVQQYDQTFRQQRLTAPQKSAIKTLARDIFADGNLTLQGNGLVQSLEATPGNPILAEFQDGRPAIVKHSHGNGSIYFLATPLESRSYAELLDRLFEKAGIQRAVRVLGGQGKRVWGIETRNVRQGRGRLLYVVNHTADSHSVQIKVPESLTQATELRTGRAIQPESVALKPHETQIIKLASRE